MLNDLQIHIDDEVIKEEGHTFISVYNIPVRIYYVIIKLFMCQSYILTTMSNIIIWKYEMNVWMWKKIRPPFWYSTNILFGIITNW